MEKTTDENTKKYIRKIYPWSFPSVGTLLFMLQLKSNSMGEKTQIMLFLQYVLYLLGLSSFKCIMDKLLGFILTMTGHKMTFIPCIRD